MSSEEDTTRDLDHTPEEDEFGGFDEFDEFDDPASNQQSTNANSDINKIKNSVESLNLNPSAPLLASSISSLSDDEIRSHLITPPTVSSDEVIKSVDTPTSQQLWQHLTETSIMPLPKWDGSSIHRQLALCLGLPLNLDKSLPKVQTRKMDLPTQHNMDIDGLQNIPDWTLLSITSGEALDHMSEDELSNHIGKLEGAILGASELQETMESNEMDLEGEKNILEGMVESLLVFSQRNQRERLKKKMKS